jgi:hypothetical protein
VSKPAITSGDEFMSRIKVIAGIGAGLIVVTLAEVLGGSERIA